MKVEEKGNIIHIKDTSEDVVVFIEKINNQYNAFLNKSMVIDLLHNPTIQTRDIELFKELSKQHKKHKKSFVIVAKAIDFNRVSEKIQVVPTVLEAFDIIEIEEIERDLGF